MTQTSESGSASSPIPGEGGDSGDPDGVAEFRWSPFMTIVWAVVVGALTVLLVLGAGVGIALFEWMQLPAGLRSPDAEVIAQFLQQRVQYHMPLLTVVQALFLIFMVLVLTRPRGGVSRARMLGLERISIVRCLKWALGGIVALFVITTIPQLFIEMGHDEALDWMDMLQPAWLGVLLLVVFAPLSEELAFRGFLYGGLARSWIGPAGAVLVTSGIWTVIHVQYTWLILTQLFIYGLVFGALRWLSGSLWPSIVAHGVVNAIAAVTFYGGFGDA